MRELIKALGIYLVRESVNSTTLRLKTFLTLRRESKKNCVREDRLCQLHGS